MIAKKIKILIKSDGSYLDTILPPITANEDGRTIVQVIAPFPITDIVSVNYSIRPIQATVKGSYLLPTGKFGKDVLDEDYTHFQTVADWNVFEIPINAVALEYISKYRAGLVLVSFTIKQLQTPYFATNYLGLFSNTQPIPATSYNDGDYFIANEYNFTAHDITWAKGDYAYFYNGKWNKGKSVLKASTPSIELPVDPSLKDAPQLEYDEDVALLLANDLGLLTQRVSQAETDIESAENDINEIDGRVGVNETDIYNLESDVGNLQSDKADKTELVPIISELERLENEKVDLSLYTYDKGLQNTRDNAQENRLDTVEIDVANLENQNLLHSPTFNGTNGHLTFQRYGASPIVIDLPTEMIVTSGVYDDINNELVLNLASGGEVRIPVGNLLTDLDAENIRYNGAGTYYLSGKNRVEQAINELDLQVKAVNDNKLDASVYNNDIPLIDAELLRLEDDKANKSELVASDVATSEVGVSVQDAIDDVEARFENVETEVMNNTEINREQDYRIATIEEAYRKSQSGELTATKNGTDIISLGKDIAPAPLQVKVDGGLLESKQLVTNDTFSNGTMGWQQFGLDLFTVTDGIATIYPNQTNGRLFTNILVVGVKYYVVSKFKTPSNQVALFIGENIGSYHSLNNQYEVISTLATAGSNILGIIDERTSSWGEILIDYIYTFNISTLIANKTYSPLYNKTFDLMLDAEIKAQMDLWVQNGTLPNDNVLAVGMNKRVRSVGKNLFDKNASEIIANYTLDVSTGLETALSNYFISDYISVGNNTNYYLSGGTPGPYLTMVEYDNNLNVVKVSNSYGGFIALTTLTTTSFIRLSHRIDMSDPVQLEQGIVATTYVPYANTDLYLQANKVGYKLPNGVADTIGYRNGKYYYVQRVQEYVLQASDIATLTTTGTNVDRITITNLTGFGDIPFLSVANHMLEGYTQAVGYSSNFDTLDNINKTLATSYLSATDIYLLVPKGTYANLVEAQTALAGTVIYYQLATPVETEILALGNAQGLSGGTVYIDDIMADSNIYTSKYDIENTEYPIKALDRIVKINADGSQAELAVSSATVAGDGLSFTHPSLVANDIVWIAYAYNAANLFKSNTFVTYYDNPFIAIQPNGTPRRIVFAVDDSGVVTVSSQAV